jgi:hypothetical protein
MALIEFQIETNGLTAEEAVRAIEEHTGMVATGWSEADPAGADEQKTALDHMVEGAITREFANVNQSWELTAIYETPAGTRLRVHIRRNAYDSQSYGKVEAWSPTGLQWNQVHYLSHRQLEVCARTGPMDREVVLYVRPQLDQAGIEAFAADESTLLTVAMQVLRER